MTTMNLDSTVTIAGNAEVDRAVATLVLAFGSAPVARWMYQTPDRTRPPLDPIPRLLPIDQEMPSPPTPLCDHLPTRLLQHRTPRHQCEIVRPLDQRKATVVQRQHATIDAREIVASCGLTEGPRLIGLHFPRRRTIFEKLQRTAPEQRCFSGNS
jgi:hypothetical protein